jgi:arsenate reductase
VKVLFLCTGNSCRSQMAEGWARKLHPERIDAYSAGTRPHAVDPRAVRVMAEAGIDIAAQKPKHVHDVMDVGFDVVVTVCDHVHENCPVFPGPTRIIHRGFEDPPRLAADARTEEEALSHYRRVRDEIRRYVETLPRILPKAEPAG